MANQTKAPPYPKGNNKFSDAKLRDIIPNLPIQECLKIEYKAKGIWFRMISKRAINRYNCECCGVENLGPTPVLDHLRGKKHRLALQIADKLFHPQYTAPRPTKSPARTPLLDAYLASDPPPVNVNTDKSSAMNESKSKPSGPRVTSAPNAVPKPKPGPASAQKPKPDGGTQAKSTPVQKPGPASSKKPINAVNNKPSDTVKAAKGSPGPGKPNETAAAKANETSAIVAKANEASATAVKPADSKPTDSKSTVSKPTDSKSTADNKSIDSKPSEASAAEAKSKESAIESNKKPVDGKTQPEIVILDDDDEDVADNKRPPPSKPAVQDTAVGRAIPVAGTAVPKSQRFPQRGRNVQVPANPIPPADRVINPAAVIAQSAELDENDKPRYQQNRVIIPSVNRKRGPENQQATPAAEQQPNFSKKSFSPKISSTNEMEGIIGVEYVVKILKVYNDPDPFYECCLCEVVLDGIGMQTHLLGYNHRFKYLEKHFPTCFNQYKEHYGNIQVMSIVFDRVAKAIEAHHGRELPYECLSGEFRSNRHGVMTTVYSFRHASEYSGPSFTNIVDAKQVDELYQNKVMYRPPKPDPKRKPTFDTRIGAPAAKKGRIDRDREHDRDRERERDRDRERERDRDRERERDRGRGMNGSSSRRGQRVEQEISTPVDDATHKLLVEEFLNQTRGKSRSPVRNNRRRNNRSRSRSPLRSQPRKRSVSPLREDDIWQAYRHLVDRSKNELDEMYKEYRKDPEKHPIYDEEWRKFWKHRKDQLTREGLDHRNYDFQPEWVRYFAVRIEELYDEAVEDIKVSSRRRLILPMTNDELQDKKYHVKTPPKEVEPQPQRYQQPKEEEPAKVSFTDKKTSVVSVLRLLTALEDYLGSLGPKIVDLLSQALLVEKTNPNEINEIILNLENCTILETAMEKLKGVLIAGLLEGPKVRAFNNVITETDKILKIAYKIRRDNPQPLMSKPVPKVLQQDFQRKSFSPPATAQQIRGNAMGGASTGAAASLLSQIDKKELATKLAAALTAQGKTDFNPEQLQQLIAVYSLIDKKKRDSVAASDKQKMTLSDTLTALLNPSAAGKSVDVGGSLGQLSNRLGGADSGGGSRGGNFLNSSEKVGAMSNSSITNFVSMLNRDNHQTSGGSGGDSEMWQNLQNIQSSLRLQNNSSNPTGGGFGNNSGNVDRGFGNNNLMGVSGGAGNFNRGGGGGGFGGQSGNDFNRGGGSGFTGGNQNQSQSQAMDDFEAGFRSGVNNCNPSRTGGNDNMMSGGRGVNDLLGTGGRVGSDMISRGRMGGGGGGGGPGGGPGGNNNFSGGNGGGGNNFPNRIGTGANNTLGFSRTSFLGGGANNFSGLSNFSTSITPGPANNNFQRSTMGGTVGGGLGGGNNMAGGNFNRAGANSAQSNFGSVGGGGVNFNNQQNRNNSGGGPTFGSAPNQRNQAGRPNNNMGGSNWRNQ
ncbi:uncharacterized protein LOC129917189 [Episyrphus balteatus]|uniref:uncharacterized protein LOC129917189 n=1 Tax=Episyrphus balteatus TaxID=286459 RepID=UPI002485E61A|nr:uncharacterized protein LOC129917189 [Episyrphus balteatus]